MELSRTGGRGDLWTRIVKARHKAWMAGSRHEVVCLLGRHRQMRIVLRLALLVRRFGFDPTRAAAVADMRAVVDATVVADMRTLVTGVE